MSASNIRRIRKRKMQAQKGLCFYCNQPMWLQNNKVFCSKHGLTGAQAKSLKCTSEHLTARRDGGTDSDENIVAACMFCNQKRHKTPNPLSPEAYQKKVKDRVLRGKWHGVNLVRTTTS